MATNKNITRLKKVQADAKKLKAKNPKLTHIEAVKKAWAMQPKATGTKNKTARKKVGATKFVEAKETTKTKPSRVIKVTRKKNGTFKKFETIGSVMAKGKNLLVEKLGKLEAKKFVAKKVSDKRKLQKEITSTKTQLRKFL